MDWSIRAFASNDFMPSRAKAVDSVIAFSALFVGLVFVVACLAPWIAPYGLGGMESQRMLQTPSASHWMGTDSLGRDLLTRVLYGARVSLAVGLGTALISLLLGTTYGLLAGFKGGNWDHLMIDHLDQRAPAVYRQVGVARGVAHQRQIGRAHV